MTSKASEENESISVFARVRPALRESERNAPAAVFVGDDGLSLKCSKTEYNFSGVFGPQKSTSEVHAATVGAGLVTAALQGRNAAIFAYGQSGAGKTHTLLGSSREPGLSILTVRDIFAQIASADSATSFLVRASYVELYNENLRDLLVEGPSNVKLVNRPHQGPSLSGATEIVSTGVASILDMIAAGEARRSYASTANNSVSSRSHVILRLQLESKSEGGGQTRTSAVYLVDLAGSERASRLTKGGGQAKGKLMHESANINKSLLTLGIVIRELAEAARLKSKGRSSTVQPSYRSSKLTRMLQNALGGNSRTLMLCCIRPDLPNEEETISTLKFAQQCSAVRTRSKVNVVTDPASSMLAAYQHEIESLQRQLRDAKAQAASTPVSSATVPPPAPPSTTAAAPPGKSSAGRLRSKVSDAVVAMQREEIAAANAKLDVLERMVMRSTSGNMQTKAKKLLSEKVADGVGSAKETSLLSSNAKARLRRVKTHGTSGSSCLSSAYDGPCL